MDLTSKSAYLAGLQFRGASMSLFISVPEIIKQRDLDMAFFCFFISQPFRTSVTWHRRADSSIHIRKRTVYAGNGMIFISVPQILQTAQCEDLVAVLMPEVIS